MPIRISTGVEEDTRTDREAKTGEPQVAHIVKFIEGDPSAKVLEARIYGTPLEALCGAVFVPHRDPTRLPVCAACKDIYDTYRVLDGEMPETPNS